MRAAVLREPGAAVQIRDDVEVAGTGQGQVRVRLGASGVCHSDLSMCDGTIPMPLPAVLGHEGAGEIVEVGPGVDGLQPGQRVILAWIPPCGHCFFCLGGQPNLCMSGRGGPDQHSPLSLDGAPVYPVLGAGVFAEEAVVRADAAIPVPGDVPFDVAALVGCGVLTGVGAAINTARVRPGSTVAVLGCGGVGINVVQGAQLAGAGTILAVDHVPGKLDGAVRFGATHTTSPDGLADSISELTAGRGFDYAFEVVGRSATIRQAWDATRRGGTVVIVGAGSADDQVTFSAGELFASEKRLLGSLYGSSDVRTDFVRMLELWRAGRIDLEGLVSRRIGLDDVGEAFQAMERGDVIRSVVEFPM